MRYSQDIRKEYTNGEITVVWKPALCRHLTYCFRCLPAVFRPTERPWINMDGAPTADIVSQVEKCSTGALTYYYNAERMAQRP